MTNDTVIRVENLSKKYLIGHERVSPGQRSMRDLLVNSSRRLARSAMQMARGRQIVQGDEVEEFWALKDVSFEVRRGEVMGIIGRNGAGKSTLLKILSRITEPTEGRVRIQGRVASLLEVGTGFHPELTGRENIYLNGAILGMHRAEITAKFDEIVAFAGVEKFLDTPVKRYSSGMYVRLAFAVAAHLEPEILIIDEVLAVGDAEFQKKCLGKMQDVAGNGRTVLFVSHSMQTVAKLCHSVMTLTAGQASAPDYNVNARIRAYLGTEAAAIPTWEGVLPQGCEWFEVHKVQAFQGSDSKDPATLFNNSSPIRVKVSGIIPQSNPALTFGIAVFAEDGELLFWSYTTDTKEAEWPKLHVGPFSLSTEIPARLLNAGTYRVEVIASLHFQSWLLSPGNSDAAISFTISGGLSDSPLWHERRPGLLAPVLQWKSD